MTTPDSTRPPVLVLGRWGHAGDGDPPFRQQGVERASDAPTPAQMSQALSASLGHPVRFDEVPMPAVRQGSPDMAAMWGFLHGRDTRPHILGSIYCAAGTWTAWGLSMMLVWCLS